MLIRLFLAFTLMPIVELALLMQASQYLGVLLTVALVLATGAAGAALARAQGGHALRQLRQSVSGGTFPGEPLFDGVLILAGGLLLLTPGFVTDLIGLAALVPGTRHLLKAWLKREVRLRLNRGQIRVYDSREEPCQS